MVLVYMKYVTTGRVRVRLNPLWHIEATVEQKCKLGAFAVFFNFYVQQKSTGQQ